MIRLSSIITLFETTFLQQYKNRLLPSHKKALGAMKVCRTRHSLLMLARCDKCDEQVYVPHSCGHRSCPHCQHHESQQWLERQLKKTGAGGVFSADFYVACTVQAVGLGASAQDLRFDDEACLGNAEYVQPKRQTASGDAWSDCRVTYPGASS